MPSSVLNGQVPHSILFSKEPLYIMPPHVFGSMCFVHDLSLDLDKMSAPTIKCIFLDYSCVQNGYRCYSPSLHRFSMSTDATFLNGLPTLLLLLNPMLFL